jgi:multiple sugar transport system ATP-binding protein
LFVAKFLGNPPINILDGFVKNGKIMINDKFEIGLTNVPDGNYTMGIRPEDFQFRPEGFEINSADVEHIGRDTLIRFAMGEKSVRALVDSDSVEGHKTIRLCVKPGKILLFDKETGNVVL